MSYSHKFESRGTEYKIVRASISDMPSALRSHYSMGAGKVAMREVGGGKWDISMYGSGIYAVMPKTVTVNPDDMKPGLYKKVSGKWEKWK